MPCMFTEMPKTYCRSKPNTASFFDWIATPEPTLHMILHSRRHHAGACLVLMVCQYCMIQWSCTCSAETQNTTYGKQILLVLLSPRWGLHVVCVFTSHLGVDPTLPSSGSSNTHWHLATESISKFSWPLALYIKLVESARLSPTRLSSFKLA